MPAISAAFGSDWDGIVPSGSGNSKCRATSRRLAAGPWSARLLQASGGLGNDLKGYHGEHRKHSFKAAARAARGRGLSVDQSAILPISNAGDVAASGQCLPL